MAVGYIRQSAASIAAGLTITSAAHNNEFNAIAQAFDATLGHNHNGTTGGGALIPPGSLSNLSGSLGILVNLDNNNFVARQLIAGTGCSITYPDGIAGNPVITFTGTTTPPGPTDPLAVEVFL